MARSDRHATSALGRNTLSPAKAVAGKVGDLFAFGRFVAFFDRFLFGDVLTLLGLAVKARAFLVIDVRLRVDPHETVPSTRGGCRFSDRLGSGCSGSGWAS